MKIYFKSLAILTLATATLIAAPRGKMANPDFTKGDAVPKGASQDWTLGATGARGWIYSKGMETTEARQIYVTKVHKDSPADGTLEVGDVILGVAGKAFSYDPRTEFGKALTAAESDALKGDLSVIRWRKGQQQNVVIKLPALGNYSATAPFDCPKSTHILKQGCETLAKRMVEDKNYTRQNPISRSLNALALLASGDPKYLPLVKREAKWASDYSADGMAGWYYSYVISFLSEYTIATGDKSFIPGLTRLTLEVSNGASAIGSWGHKFADANGRLLGYGMMNATGIPLTTSLVLAREAGVKAPKLDTTIKNSANLLRFYAGKGSIPYGDHDAWIQNHDDNGKNGMAAVLFSLLGESETAGYFSKMSLACHGNERDTGHTGNFWNMTWAMPGVVQSGPHATGAWMKEFGSWYYDLARGWDGTFRHQGPPQERQDSTGNWDGTGAYLLAYAMPLKKIMLTGKKPSAIPPLTAREAKSIIIDGRGWTNNNRNAAYDKLSMQRLFERLTNWSPVVRERAAMAIARRKNVPDPVPTLVEMLELPEVETKIGVSQALVRLRGKAAPAVPTLIKNLKHENLWLRVQSANALAAIGDPAMEALPELITMLSRGATEEDPRAMEQRYITFALFNRGGMLSRSLDGVDRDLLFKAVRAGLTNEDGRARGSYSTVYTKLSFDELKPIMPEIYAAIAKPAPSGIMFADEIRTAGLNLFAQNHVSEGIELTADYARNMKKHASEHRIIPVMNMLKKYGEHAQRVIPHLEETARYFEGGEEGFPHRLSKDKAKVVRAAIKEIKASKDRPKLRRVKD